MKLLSYEYREPVSTIVMDDGKVNLMSSQMLSELNAALDRAVADQAPVLITGREGVFSAGFDLQVLRAGGFPARDMMKAGFELSERLLSFPTPVLVACSGHAIAMGVFLLLAADYRIGADGPFKIGANEVAIGLTMPRFAIEICRQRLAPAHFNRAMTIAELYSPAQAVHAGFLDRVVPAAELLSAAQGVMAQLATLNMPAHKATKLRARSSALVAIRAAIEADDAEFLARQ